MGALKLLPPRRQGTECTQPSVFWGAGYTLFSLPQASCWGRPCPSCRQGCSLRTATHRPLRLLAAYCLLCPCLEGLPDPWSPGVYSPLLFLLPSSIPDPQYIVTLLQIPSTLLPVPPPVITSWTNEHVSWLLCACTQTAQCCWRKTKNMTCFSL